MKILHTADWHLNRKDYDECVRCLMFLVDRAEEEKPDLIVIAGDIYDRQDTPLDSDPARLAMDAVRSLSDIAPVVILIGTYSHEGSASLLLRYADASGGRVLVSDPVMPGFAYLHDGRLSPLPWDKNDAVISLVPPLTKKFIKGLEDLSVEDSDLQAGQLLGAYLLGMGAEAHNYPEAAHILVGHWTVGGCNISDTQIMVGRDIELNHEQINMVGADLVCLGHIHYAQQIGKNIFYSGSLYRKDFGELDDKGFWIHTIKEYDWSIKSSEFIKTPSRMLIKYEMDLTTMGPMDGESMLVDIMADPNMIGAFVRVNVKFNQDDEATIDFDAIQHAYKGAGAADVDIVKIRVPSTAVRSETILNMRTFSDKLEHYADIEGVLLTDGMRDAAAALETKSADEILATIVNGGENE